MKVVLNGRYGGFRLGEGFVREYCFDSPYADIERNDSRLVAWVENHPDDNPNLRIAEIPDNATDYMINEYDGLESVIMVIDGKLAWA